MNYASYELSLTQRWASNSTRRIPDIIANDLAVTEDILDTQVLSNQDRRYHENRLRLIKRAQAEHPEMTV